MIVLLGNRPGAVVQMSSSENVRTVPGTVDKGVNNVCGELCGNRRDSSSGRD